MAEKTAEMSDVERARAALVEMANQGFIKFPVAAVYVGSFMTDLAQEYVKLRNANPDGDKFQQLKTAVQNARNVTGNAMLNSETAPSAEIQVISEAGGFFGKRSINKFLDKLV
jgi:hypothetical protein